MFNPMSDEPCQWWCNLTNHAKDPVIFLTIFNPVSSDERCKWSCNLPNHAKDYVIFLTMFNPVSSDEPCQWTCNLPYHAKDNVILTSYRTRPLALGIWWERSWLLVTARENKLPNLRLFSMLRLVWLDHKPRAPSENESLYLQQPFVTG